MFRPSVSALLAARLDRLPAAERDLLERVSVIGLEFTTDQARLLARPDRSESTATLLTALARRDLLRRGRGVTGDLWAFRHVMVRDAAYEALPKAERAELHVRFADDLADHAGQAGGEHEAFVAHHLGQAGQVRRAARAPRPGHPGLGRPSRGRAGRRRPAGQAAGGHAWVRSHSWSGRSSSPPTLGVGSTSIIALHRLQFERYEYGAVRRLLGRFEETLDDPSAQATDLDRAYAALWRQTVPMLRRRGVDPDTLVQPARDVVALATDAGDDVRRVLALWVLVDLCVMNARWAGLGELIDEIMEIGDNQDRRMAELWMASLAMYGTAPMSTLVAWAEERSSAAARRRRRSTSGSSTRSPGPAAATPTGKQRIDAALRRPRGPARHGRRDDAVHGPAPGRTDRAGGGPARASWSSSAARRRTSPMAAPTWRGGPCSTSSSTGTWTQPRRWSTRPRAGRRRTT